MLISSIEDQFILLGIECVFYEKCSIKIFQTGSCTSFKWVEHLSFKLANVGIYLTDHNYLQRHLIDT